MVSAITWGKQLTVFSFCYKCFTIRVINVLINNIFACHLQLVQRHFLWQHYHFNFSILIP